MRIFIYLLFLTLVVPVSAQITSIKDCQQLALAKDADGNNVMFYFIPTDGALEREAVRTDPDVLLIMDKNGTRIFSTETLEKLSDIESGVDVFQVSHDGYLALSEKAMLSDNGIHFYNFAGEKIWKIKGKPIIAEPINNVVINLKKDKYTAYDMPTGKLLWEKKVPQKNHYAHCNSYTGNLDRGHYYMIADSLVRLNLRTGETITRPFRAGRKSTKFWSLSDSYKKLSDRRLIRELYNSSCDAKIASGTHSNWIVRGDSMFVADADTLYCLNHDLQDIWKTALPADMGAKSSIRLSDGKIFMQNFGIAFNNGTIESCGKPFGAVYDAADGRLLSLTTPDIDRWLAGGTYTADGRLYWQTNKKMLYTDEGGDAVSEVKWKPVTNYLPDAKCPDFVICDTVYVARDGFLESVVSDRSQLVVEVYGKDVNVIGSDGKVSTIPADEVFFKDCIDVYSTNGDRKKRSRTLIVEPGTRKIKYSFYINGWVCQDENGNIVVCTPQGIGFKAGPDKKG